MRLRSAILGFALLPAFALADGVTRSVETVTGGIKVTLAWEFSGEVESDLIVEERYATGWSVNDATVPYASLDATWFSGPVARFAVKPARLAQPGSISFTVVAGAGAVSGNASGEWKMYLAGALKNGIVGGQGAMTCESATASGAEALKPTDKAAVETAVAISSFQMTDGGCELAYDVANAGTIVVEGCKGLGQAWTELKRAATSAGNGKVSLTTGEVGGCCFMRLKLLTEEK